MAERPLLPNEPRVPDWEHQQALTERFLQPELAKLEALFLALRTQLDLALAAAQPLKNDKPYPLGQCLEISLAAMQELKRQPITAFSADAAAGYRALHAFLSAGGQMRQVWGDLRGEYFQNAFVVGTLYLDVANDTVVPSKPKVEILPLENAHFVPITDYLHFARIATRYWKAHVFPNHVLPELAPHFPLISVTPNGQIRLQSSTDYFLSLTRLSGFQPSEDTLADLPFDNTLFDLFARCCAGSGFTVADNAAAGQELAIQHCRHYRSMERHRSLAHLHEAIQAAKQANICFSQGLEATVSNGAVDGEQSLMLRLRPAIPAAPC
jgi:hypothetical protein